MKTDYLDFDLAKERWVMTGNRFDLMFLFSQCTPLELASLLLSVPEGYTFSLEGTHQEQIYLRRIADDWKQKEQHIVKEAHEDFKEQLTRDFERRGSTEGF